MPIILNGDSGITTPTYGGTDTSEYLVPVTAFKNRIINGAMSINQRVTSLATNNTQGYFVDRMWGFSSAMACTFSQQSSSGVAGFPFFARAQRNSGQGAGGGYFMGQIIESNNLQDLQGQTITVSFWARAGANYSAASNLLYVFSRTGTTADQGLNALIGGWAGQIDQNVPVTLTTSFQKFTASFTLASNMQELSIFFSCPSTGTAGANDYFDITGFQIELGSTATSFDYRPYGTELALCQRYYFNDVKYIASIVSGVAVTGTNYPVEMRAAPTITGGAAGFAEVVKTTKGLYYYQTTTSGQTLTFTSEL